MRAYARAESLLEKALEIQEKAPGPEHLAWRDPWKTPHAVCEPCTVRRKPDGLIGPIQAGSLCYIALLSIER
jgi:hypothetical protein